MGWIMKKNFKVIIVICIFLSMLFVVSGCSFLNDANAAGEKKTTTLKDLLGKLKPKPVDLNAPFYEQLEQSYFTDILLGNINYKIDYQWSDINLDIVNYPQFADYGLGSKEYALELIDKAESENEKVVISQLYGLGFENLTASLNFDTISNISKDYKTRYNTGHTGLNKEYEVIVPKWMYFYLYCATLDEITCDIDTIERVLSDELCLQRDMFLGIESEFWSSEYSFPTAYSMVIGLDYYGVINADAPKGDMKIYLPKKGTTVYEFDGEEYETTLNSKPNTNNCYELSVIGYYETEIDSYFDKVLKKGECDFDSLAEYLSNCYTVYFK